MSVRRSSASPLSLCLLGVVLSPFVSACGHEREPAGHERDTLAFVEYAPRGEGGDSALLAGRVVDDHGCLRIRHDVDQSLVTPAFPSDSDAGSLRPGREVELAGGQSAGLPPEATVPGPCADSDAPYWIVAE